MKGFYENTYMHVCGSTVKCKCTFNMFDLLNDCIVACLRLVDIE